MSEETNKMEVTVLESTALTSITEGEINVQVATAHKFPRSLALFNKRAEAMVSQDEETAASCMYSRPVGKTNGKMKYAEGMSVRMAEIVGASYGNLRAGSMIIEQTDRQVVARGMAHDLESNFASSSEVIESTVDKYGQPYSERMRVVVAKAALAKARRDAIFQVVPKALCKRLEDLARKTVIGDASTLEKRRNGVMAWIGKLGISDKRVYNAIGIAGLEDIGINELELLTGLKTAIKEGDTTIDEAFPGNSKPETTAPKTKAEVKSKKKPPEGRTVKTEEKKIEAKPVITKLNPVQFAEKLNVVMENLFEQGMTEKEIGHILLTAGYAFNPKDTDERDFNKVIERLESFLEKVA